MRLGITLLNLFRSPGGPTLLPLGCLWLRASLERAGHDVEIRDLQHLPDAVAADADAIASHLDDSLDVVGISAMTDMLPLAIAVTRRLKQRRPERPVVLGGWGPTSVADRLVAAFPCVDFVVRGEGEETLVELLAALPTRDVTQVRGVSGRVDGRRFRAPDRGPVADVAGLPEPRLGDLRLADYDYYTTVTARGCPYQCRFCEIPMVESRRVRARSVDAVVAELVAVHEAHGVDYVAFQDDILLLSKPRVNAIAAGLERAGVPMRWAGFARAGRVDTDWLLSLRDRGLSQVVFGMEAGSDALLDGMYKGMSLTKAVSGLARAATVVDVRCFFLWGFPDEQLVDFLGTAQAIFHAEFLGATVEVGQVVPLPGSPLALAHEGPLEFHERYPFCRIIVPPVGQPELLELVVTHPDIFSAFYAFPTPDRETKWALADRICCRS